MKLKIVLTYLLIFSFLIGYSQEERSAKAKRNQIPSIEKGLTKISVMYPYSEGKTFDMEYYETKHMPMVAAFLGSNLVKYTIEKGLSSGIPNQPLPYMAVGTFYVKNLSEYQATIAPNLDSIRADFANYTNVVPVILVSEVVK